MSMLSQALGFDRARNMRTDIDTSQLEQMYGRFSDPYANYGLYARAMADAQPSIDTFLSTSAATGGNPAIARQSAMASAAQGGEQVLNQLGQERLQRDIKASDIGNMLSQYDVQEIQLEDQKQQALQGAAMQPFKLGANILSGGAFSPLLGVASKGLSGAAGLLGNLGQADDVAKAAFDRAKGFVSGVGDGFGQGFGAGMKQIGGGIASAGRSIGGLLGSAGQSVGNYYQGLQAQNQAQSVPQPTYQNQNVPTQITAPTTQTASPPPPPVAPATAQPNNFTYSNYAVGGNVPTMGNLAFNMSTLPQQQMGGGFMGGGLFGLTNNFTLGGGYR